MVASGVNPWRSGGRFTDVCRMLAEPSVNRSIRGVGRLSGLDFGETLATLRQDLTLQAVSPAPRVPVEDSASSDWPKLA